MSDNEYFNHFKTVKHFEWYRDSDTTNSQDFEYLSCQSYNPNLSNSSKNLISSQPGSTASSRPNCATDQGLIQATKNTQNLTKMEGNSMDSMPIINRGMPIASAMISQNQKNNNSNTIQLTSISKIQPQQFLDDSEDDNSDDNSDEKIPQLADMSYTRTLPVENHAEDQNAEKYDPGVKETQEEYRSFQNQLETQISRGSIVLNPNLIKSQLEERESGLQINKNAANSSSANLMTQKSITSQLTDSMQATSLTIGSLDTQPKNDIDQLLSLGMNMEYLDENNNSRRGSHFQDHSIVSDNSNPVSVKNSMPLLTSQVSNDSSRLIDSMEMQWNIADDSELISSPLRNSDNRLRPPMPSSTSNFSIAGGENSIHFGGTNANLNDTSGMKNQIQYNNDMDTLSSTSLNNQILLKNISDTQNLSNLSTSVEQETMKLNPKLLENLKNSENQDGLMGSLPDASSTDLLRNSKTEIQTNINSSQSLSQNVTQIPTLQNSSNLINNFNLSTNSNLLTNLTSTHNTQKPINHNNLSSFSSFINPPHQNNHDLSNHVTHSNNINTPSSHSILLNNGLYMNNLLENLSHTSTNGHINNNNNSTTNSSQTSLNPSNLGSNLMSPSGINLVNCSQPNVLRDTFKFLLLSKNVIFFSYFFSCFCEKFLTNILMFTYSINKYNLFSYIF